MPQRVDCNRPRALVNGVFMFLFYVLDIAVVDDMRASEAEYFGRNDALQAADLSRLPPRMQPHERIDELLLVGEGGQVEEEVLDSHLVLMGGLQSHCQVHLVERALQCDDVAPHLLTILELARKL